MGGAISLIPPPGGANTSVAKVELEPGEFDHLSVPRYLKDRPEQNILVVAHGVRQLCLRRCLVWNISHAFHRPTRAPCEMPDVEPMLIG